MAGGALRFETVMALDNDPSVVKVFNNNHPRPGGGQVARRADLTWFKHPSEVLLYYLAHRATLSDEGDLRGKLDNPAIGYGTFLSEIASVDRQFAVDLQVLAAQESFQAALGSIDARAFSLAICRSFLLRLGLSSLRRPSLSLESLPWAEEYTTARTSTSSVDVAKPELKVLRQNASALWLHEVNKLADAATKIGHGQHVVVNARLQSLVLFLLGPSGRKLEKIWIAWRARRDSVRASRCLAMYPSLRELYDDSLHVGLVLGGPPCKGFSRIGRAVLESLRSQGASAWTSHEYGDERNALMHQYVLVLEALKPDAFLFENVAHFASALKTPSGRLDASTVLRQSIEDLSQGDLSYQVQSQIVKAREYGVPQDRERFIMVGFSARAGCSLARADFFDLEKFEHDVPLSLALQGLAQPFEFSFGTSGQTTSDLARAYTLIDPAMPQSHVRYSNWIRQIDPQGSPVPLVDGHIVRRGRADDVALMSRLAPGQRWMDLKVKSSDTLQRLQLALDRFAKAVREHPELEIAVPEEIEELRDRTDSSLFLRLMLEDIGGSLGTTHHLLEHQYLEKGADAHGDWLERLYAHRPCKTIVAHIGKDTYGYIHPHEDRAISLREAARVQSFPDWFKFGGAGIVSGYSMIGNAVPPLLARTFAARFAAMHIEAPIFGARPTVG